MGHSHRSMIHVGRHGIILYGVSYSDIVANELSVAEWS